MQDPIYWVTPVIREQEFSELEQSIRKETHKAAYEWYDSQFKDADEPAPEQSEKAMFHALACGNVRGACKHGVIVGNYKNKLLLHREIVEIQETVAQRITMEIIDEVKKEEDEYVAMLLNNLGSTWDNLGEYQKAIEFYNKVLAIDMAVFGENYPQVAIRYNLWSAWKALGEYQKAIEFYNKALAIFMDFFGPDHPSTKTIAKNIEDLQQ